MDKPRYDLRIDATGPNGNIFAVLGNARTLLRAMNETEDLERLTVDVLTAKSYADAIAAIREYFPVDLDEGEER